MNSQIRMPFDDRLRGMLAGGAPLHGMFIGLPAPALVEMCAFAGFDFVVIDNEHGSADLQMTEHLLRAARASGIPALVRCLEHDLARVLDMGASGVQIPMVESAAHARDLVQRVRYPMPGGLGVGAAAPSARAPRVTGHSADRRIPTLATRPLCSWPWSKPLERWSRPPRSRRWTA